MFNCHINAELCISRTESIKYLFKYICKGGDRITAEVLLDGEAYDEISRAQDCRYISATEATWRLLEYQLVYRYPPVIRLDVHLENHHTVYYTPGNEREAAARQRPGTKLTEWMQANEKHQNARHLLYTQYGE